MPSIKNVRLGWLPLAAGFLAAAGAHAQEEVKAGILKHRTAEVVLSVKDADGNPLANAPVTVRQVRHKFMFGCNIYGFDNMGTNEDRYRSQFAELFNYATLPFYWGGYEKEQGKTGEERVKKAAEWCARHGIRTKGHPLVWHEVPPSWSVDLKTDELKGLQMARVSREVSAFAGLIDIWDVVNEAVIMPTMKKPVGRLAADIGVNDLIKESFQRAREPKGKRTLVLNDFDTTPAYEKLIGDCLTAGVSIDVIGIQSHMHCGCWERQQTLDVCNRFSRFGKPLHFTELTILSGKNKTDDDWFAFHPDWNTTPEGEALQKDRVVEFYSLLFSLPQVEAITWWDLSDEQAWQGAPAGLLRKDMTPKPAYLALLDLVKREWWTGPLNLTTDAQGAVRFRGFLGDYEVEANDRTGAFTIDRPDTGKAAATLGKVTRQPE